MFQEEYRPPIFKSEKDRGELTQLPEFDDHRFVAFLNDRSTGLVGFIAIHRQHPLTSSFGATRLWTYPSELEALKDVLRLSRMMSYKAALAGLKCGGAKAVLMASPEARRDRKALLASYAEKVNYLKGQFITGADVGLDQNDLQLMREISPYFVGSDGTAGEFTALGLLYGIEVSLKEILGKEAVNGRTFAIQGLGKVGRELLKILYPKAKKLFVSDVDLDVMQAVKKEYPKVAAVMPDEIYKQEVDVYCPCALSHSLNNQTISALNCRIVVGGANNQLAGEEAGELLRKLGILYAPDYVVNAGGLISIVDEFDHKHFNPQRVTKKVFRIKNTLSKIFTKAKKQRLATNLVANAMAEKVFNNYR